MGTFTNAVKEKVVKKFAEFLKVQCTTGDQSSKPLQSPIPLDLVARLPPDFIEQAVRDAIAYSHPFMCNDRDAVRILKTHSASALLFGDALLDRLHLVGTPHSSVFQVLFSLVHVIDLNRSLGGADDFSTGLLGMMAQHRIQIPLFFDDLKTVFESMGHVYSKHPVLGDDTRWESRYDFRNGILGVTGKLLQFYGVPYNPERHTWGFGANMDGQRRVLQETTMVYMEALCNSNISVANQCSVNACVDSNEILPGKANWRVALSHAKDATIEAKRKTQLTSSLEAHC